MAAELAATGEEFFLHPQLDVPRLSRTLNGMRAWRLTMNGENMYEQIVDVYYPNFSVLHVHVQNKRKRLVQFIQLLIDVQQRMHQAQIMLGAGFTGPAIPAVGSRYADPAVFFQPELDKNNVPVDMSSAAVTVRLVPKTTAPTAPRIDWTKTRDEDISFVRVIHEIDQDRTELMFQKRRVLNPDIYLICSDSCLPALISKIDNVFYLFTL